MRWVGAGPAAGSAAAPAVTRGPCPSSAALRHVEGIGGNPAAVDCLTSPRCPAGHPFTLPEHRIILADR